MNHKKVDKLISQVLTENYVTAPPVRIDDIARNYGLNVVEVEFDPEFGNIAGFIDPDKKTVYVNAQDSAAKKAFTIAYELGQWLMHQDTLQQDPDSYILYKTPIGSARRSIEDAEARYFAANILVPKNMYSQYKKPNDDPNFLAKIFGVSVEVVSFAHDES